MITKPVHEVWIDVSLNDCDCCRNIVTVIVIVAMTMALVSVAAAINGNDGADAFVKVAGRPSLRARLRTAPCGTKVCAE